MEGLADQKRAFEEDGLFMVQPPLFF